MGKVKGAPKNIVKGGKGVGSGVNKGLNKGVSGVNKGLNGVSKNFKRDKKEETPPPPPEQQISPPTPERKPLNRNLNPNAGTFDWESIGYYQDEVSKGGDGETILAKSEAMRTYLSDAYYSDFYINTVLVIGTCFFSWLVAHFGGGLLWLGVVFFGTASVYRAEFRRFVRDTRDDMLRLSISDRLENETETLEWMNNLLSKVWIVYMPLMGDIVKANVNPILAGVAPGGGIDAVELSQFHLGSVAPKVTAIKSYTKIGKDAYEMDWAFAFDPNNRENMTKAEIRKQIMPKVVIKAALGKGIISKKIPFSVQDMGFVGRMKIRMSFTDRFPMIEIIRVQFLEPPKIDYALKPLSGDSFGIDIMKFVPGLKSLINDGINWAIKSFLIAPNYQEVNLVDMMNAASTDANSVLVVDLKDATLSSGTDDYYAVISADNNADDSKKIRTDIKKDTKNPVWNKTHYVLLNSINQNLNIEFFKNNSFGKDKLVGIAQFDLNECLQKEHYEGLSVKIDNNGKKQGFANFDLHYYPELQAETEEDGSKGATPESEVGILNLTLNEAKGLDLSSSLVGQLSPYAEIFINGKLNHKTRVLKRSNEPSFGDIIETLISSKSETNIKIVIRDSVGFAEDTVLGDYEGTLDDIITQVAASGNQMFKLSPKGFLKLTPTWRPVAMTQIASDVTHRDPLGTFRIHIRDAVDLKNLEFHGKVDPYVKVLINGKVKYETVIHPETLDPIFEEVAWIPVVSESQYISLEVYDAEKNGKDRSLGSTSFKAEEFLHKGTNEKYIHIDGSNVIKEAPLFVSKAKKSKGVLNYSLSFYPVTPVYTPKEVEELETEDEKIRQQLVKEDEEQAKLKKAYEKKPNDYEWVEVDSPFKDRDPHKKKIPVEELLTYQSGVLSVNIMKGNLTHKKAFLSVLVDEAGYPGLTTGPASNGLISTSHENIFIRDLKNSLFVLRETTKEEVEEQKDVLLEKTFPTAEILKKGYNEPITLQLGDDSTVTLQVAFSPAKLPVEPVDTMLDTGNITIDILDGEDLISADSNGKSDPFAVIELNGAEVFKTEVVKKTLHPKWNESATFPIPSLSRTKLIVHVFDWDLAGDNDDLGQNIIDLTGVIPGDVTDITVPLVLKGHGDAGKVNFKVKFEPQYIRPQVQKFGGGLPGIGSVTKAPVKLVGGVAKGALGGAGLIAGGVGKGGSKLLGAFGGSKRKSKRDSTASFNGSKKENLDNGDSQSTLTHSTTNNTKSGGAAGGVNGSGGTVNAIGTNTGAGGIAGAGAAVVGTAVANQSNGNGERAAQVQEGNPNANGLSKQATANTSLFGGRRSAGRLTVKNLTASNDNHSSLQFKVLLKNQELGTKEIHKTRASKLSGGVYTFGEESTFKAIPDDLLIFQAKVHHRLGKDEVVGEGQIPLAGLVDNDEDFTLEIANVGNLVLNVRYSAPK